MHRQPLLAALSDYGRRHPGEVAVTARFEAFVRRRPDCFERSCLEGHVTASAWVVSPRRDAFLLCLHRKLGAWLQLGGHADGDPDPEAVAAREVREESGLGEIRVVEGAEGARILDLDIHEIPALGEVPAHLHYDVRFLMLAADTALQPPPGEVLDLRWFPADTAARTLGEESLRRLHRKASGRLAELA